MDCSLREKCSGHALTVIRVVLGIIFIMHGSQKVLGLFGGLGLAGTVGAFVQMKMPAPLAYMVCFGELSGGIALVFGFLTRIAAAGIIIIMIGAVVTVHWANGFFLNWYMIPGHGHGYEYNLALIAMSISLILGGPGGCAIDNLFCKKKLN
jgi:putative oxidoreductase